MRLSPRTITSACKLSPFLALLLPAVKTISAAKRELAWLQAEIPFDKLYHACRQRGRYSVPLQYILKSQPFGDLDIKCSNGVLIPRWETEEWAIRLGHLIRDNQSRVGQVVVSDLFTGTGCILLTLAKMLSSPASSSSSSSCFLSGTAVDISPTALSLVRQNIRKNNLSSLSLSTVLDNVLSPKNIIQCDLLTANPPYISNTDYFRSTERSVRLHEPKLALIGGESFYASLFKYAHHANAQALVCEVGCQSQIDFVHSTAASSGWDSVGFKDSAGNPRGAAAWRSSRWQFLHEMEKL